MAFQRNLLKYAKEIFPRSRSLLYRISDPESFSLLTITADVGVCVALTALIDTYIGWYYSNGRIMYGKLKANMNMGKMLWDLDRKKKESPEAYLQKMHSEIETIKKSFLCERMESGWEVDNYARKVAVLKLEFHAWTQEVDTAARP